MWRWLVSSVQLRDQRIIRAIILSLITNIIVLFALFLSFESRLIVLPLQAPKAVYIMRQMKKKVTPRTQSSMKSNQSVQKARKNPIQKSKSQPKKQKTQPPRAPQKTTPQVSKKTETQKQPLPQKIKQKPPEKKKIADTIQKASSPVVEKREEKQKVVSREKPESKQKADVPASTPQKPPATAQKHTEQKKPEQHETPAQQSAQPHKTEEVDIAVADSDMSTTKYEALYEAITATWRPPKGLVDGACTARITFDRQGQVKHVHVAKTSGMVAFDMAVRAALWRAKYPRWVAGQTITVLFGNE